MRYIFFAILILLGGCSKDKKSFLFNKLDSVCETESKAYTVGLDTMLPNKWDHMFFFEYSCTPEFIERKLGFKYKKYKEFSDKIIFLYKGKIIYNEEADIKFSGIDVSGGGLPYYFPYKSSEQYFEVESNKSFFTVVKMKEDNIVKFYFYR